MNVNIRSEHHDFQAPLHDTTQSGNLSICQFLIEKGAEVNVTTTARMSPLHIAAKTGNTAVCKYLIEQGAWVNAARAIHSPLYLAAEKVFDVFANFLWRKELQ